MLNGKRVPRAFAARRRRVVPRIGAERLETRELMTVIDLGGTGALPNVASVPYGVQETGLQAGGGVGWSVTDVGDLTGDGFSDFVVGAPSVSGNGTSAPTLGTGTNSAVYLIFGSKAVNAAAISWAINTGQFRVGDLGLLGNSTQTNPYNGLTGYAFDGIKIIASQNPSSLLGASVTALGFISGTSNLPAFMIGAPGANDATGANAGTGRAYIIYGSANLDNALSKTMDLDNTSSYLAPVTTLVSTNTGAHVGASVAAIGNATGSGGIDIAVGAPLAAANGLSNSGEVYLLSGAALATPTTRTLNIDTTGQAAGIPGVIFTGASAGDEAGFSVASAGDFNGVKTTANQNIDDLLIGAPFGQGTGEAYVVYGQTNLQSFEVTNTTTGIAQINLSRIGATANGFTGGVAGAVLLGATSGDEAGFAVASAGNFFNTAFGDIMIGAPEANGTGIVYVIQGVPAANELNGTFNLSPAGTNPIPTTQNEVIFIGPQSGSLAGYALAAIGDINGDKINEIAIGAPGYASAQGTVYLIPGNAGLSGQFNLSSAPNTPAVAATQITLTGSVSAAFFGASISGQLPFPGQQTSLDGGTLGDVIIGAPGYSLPNTGSNPPTTSRLNAGAVYALEGRFIPLSTPVVTTITTTIGVNSFPGPFTLNLASATFQIFVLSIANPLFDPVLDINPATLTVNGVAYPNATIAKDPKDENGDGIEDAIITFTPSSNLNLVNGTATITLAGRTTVADGNNRFSGSAVVTVVGGSGGGGSGGAFAGAVVPPGTVTPDQFIPPIGSALVPTAAALSTYDSYQPLPATIAFGQFEPSKGWLLRMLVFSGKIKSTDPSIQRHAAGRSDFSSNGVNTLGNHVFTRNPTHPGKTIKFTHKQQVIPVSRQREKYRT